MSLHTEINLENEICDYLALHGWLHEPGDAAKYDRVLALYPEDVVQWVKDSQPKAWEAIEKSNGAFARDKLITRLRDEIDQRGTLDVVRHGMDMLGLKNKLKLAEFKPALGLDLSIMERYSANRLRVIRQLKYSTANENCIDLVLFLNGIPVATAELKTDFTQNISDAVDQYRFDRLPHPKGQTPEPLLMFPRGALVHFAVSNLEVQMTTRLDGAATRFLPFNRGNDGGKGNPPGENGHPTGYLWEEVWERDSWLEILGRYIVARKNDKKQITSLIFPRYHQLDATRRLLAQVADDGPGHKYLIQHSAGSGKTNSIAWTAHFLADLHDSSHKKVFDTVLVVSDRNVIDTQLQEAVFGFERTSGVVETITNEESSKSEALAKALSGGKKIVVVTIQTFPRTLEKVRELAATQGKRFAVIADEAHSSQAGEAASKLKQVLSAEELKELEDGGEVSTEDILAAQMAAKANDSAISYVAFTATPKAKTLELFGTRPDPNQPPGPGNVPRPFHVYSMRQAIEEQFILDVLQNYITYKLAFKLAHDGKELDDEEVEHSAALKGIMGWVKLHPYNVAQKVEIVVDHFRKSVAPLLNGEAKAMVVVGSRKEAVRWQLAMRKHIKECGYEIGTLVAFSGEVVDTESLPDPVSETSAVLNPGLKGRDIRKAFDTDEYQILIAANKFQTGFDQPRLCAMYVDKRLAGIQAVQTLSRLNRAYDGKDTTYVVDFVNQADEVLEAFKTYYETATLENVTDPHIVYNLRSKLDAAGHYDDYEVERVVQVQLNPTAKQSDLIAAIGPVHDRIMKRYMAAVQNDRKEERDALQLFRNDMAAYVRIYTFLSQIFNYGNTEIEKRAIFFKVLLPLLDFGRDPTGIDLSKVMLTHHSLKPLGQRKLPLGSGAPLPPITSAGTGSVHEKQKIWLRELIEKVNDLFDADVTENDKLVYVNNVLKGKLMESETLQQQARNNTKEQFASSPDLQSELTNAIIAALDAHNLMSSQALNSPKVQDGLKKILLDHANLYEDLKAVHASG